ncbi:hypothetical protein Glove_144g54 [Diversispora epigaea]|uniref:Uncharacterized protein n=1 Tax=Diversispora epigaea TaxID=1348612 RepID=A0A397IXZ5_9GLOM|nr:hypothetical protein Glove_144g54 [Diversispora epigaea]
MAQLTAKIESFLLEAPLKAICSGSIFYLTMDGDEVGEYNTIRTLTERAVRSTSQKIENNRRRTKVLESEECRPGRAILSGLFSHIIEGFCSPLAMRAKIESFLLEAPLKAICSGSIFYLTMDGDEVGEYNTIRTLTERAVRSTSQKIENNRRRTKVMESGYNTIISLKALKALNIAQESTTDYTREEIEQNVRILKTKLGSPITNADENLYRALKKNIDGGLNVSELTWRDPIASTVLSDDSEIIKNLSHRQRRTFMEPRENMKCEVPRLISSRVDEFVENFDEIDNPNHIKNIVHDKLWKEDEFELLKTAERILGVLGDIWCNPAFSTRATTSVQSEGTYITDVIMPLLRASLSDLPNGYICLSTAERQSLASKARRNDGTGKVKMGKKPDIMALERCNGKLVEFLYVESSRIVCSPTKKTDDAIKLCFACRPTCNQFGVVGVQVAGEKIYLNVLINDASGIPRYFHLDHTEIPLTSEVRLRTKALIRLLLILRNIIIVNKNLLKHAIEQAVSHPPQNTSPSPTVTTPEHD